MQTEFVMQSIQCLAETTTLFSNQKTQKQKNRDKM